MGKFSRVIPDTDDSETQSQKESAVASSTLASPGLFSRLMGNRHGTLDFLGFTHLLGEVQEELRGSQETCRAS